MALTPRRRTRSWKRPSLATSMRMARVRQKGTTAEQLVAVELRELGLYYRKNVRTLPGSPDFANRTGRWAVFVNGCFWHHHAGCSRATTPKSNSKFWIQKFRDNRRRDARAVVKLRRDAFKVVVIWECEIDRIRAKLKKILEPRRINSG
jgi:DNA mismatch endonuclease Vsr